MKKVINITIGSVVFLIEEDAYTALDKYISDIRIHFGGSSSGDVVDDIENSIAEKFISRGKNVDKAITVDDVDEIISVMGTVEELSGDESTEPSEEQESKKETSSKRLYRDTDDVIIGGVASGIAKYFDIDPVITRVLFTIFGVFGGFGIPAYILLWIIVPPADTASKKIHMKGGRATISEIEDFVKKKIDEVPESNWKKALAFPFMIIKKIFNFLVRVFSRIGPVFSGLIGGSIAIAALVSLFAFSISFVAILSGGGVADPVIRAVVAILSDGVLGVATAASLYLLLAIPLFVVFLLGVLLIRRKKILGWIGSVILFALWFISANIIAATTVVSFDEVRAGVQEAQQEVKSSYMQKEFNDLGEFSSLNVSSNVVVNVINGDDYRVVLEGSERVLDSFRVENVDGELYIEKKHNSYLCIFYCRGLFSKISVTVTTPELDGVTFAGNVSGGMDLFESEDFYAVFAGNAEFDIQSISNTVDVKISGSGKINLRGETENLLLRLAGSSKIDGFDMEANSVEIRSSGSAKVKVSVKESLEVRLSGSGRVDYVDLGEVDVIENISGSGSVNKVTDNVIN